MRCIRSDTRHFLSRIVAANKLGIRFVVEEIGIHAEILDIRTRRANLRLGLGSISQILWLLPYFLLEG